MAALPGMVKNQLTDLMRAKLVSIAAGSRESSVTVKKVLNWCNFHIILISPFCSTCTKLLTSRDGPTKECAFQDSRHA